MPEIIGDLGREKTTILFNTIISELKKNNLYTDDVLPEYVVLLLANRHPKEKIMGDLEGLLGAETASLFTTWLFEEVERLKNAVEMVAPVPEPVVPVPAVESIVVSKDVSMKPAPRERRGSATGHGRLFSSAIKDVSGEPQRSVRRNESGRSDIPDEGFRTRRNRSFSPAPMDDTPRRSSRRVVMRRGDEEEERRDRNERGRRVVSKEEGTLKIQVADARQLISRHTSKSPERYNARRRNDRSMDVDPMINRGAVDIPMMQAAQKEKKPKCPDFPNCTKGDECEFYHPTRICTYFPTCARGKDCSFIHPPIPCKYQEGCQKPLCNYAHPSGFIPGSAPVMAPPPVPSYAPPQPYVSTVICKFHPHCSNYSCPFVHPIETPCKFGVNCNRPGCHFKHPEGVAAKAKVFTPCMYGPRCAKPGCAYQHPAPEETAMVTDQPIPADNTTDAAMAAPAQPQSIDTSNMVPQ